MKHYFSHDEGARNDPKLIKVLMKLGQEGKGVFWDLIEMLYEQNGYLLLSEIESYAFCLRTDINVIEKLIHDFGLFESDKDRFWSASVITRIGKRADKSKSASDSSRSKWKNPKDEINRANRSERLTAGRKINTHTVSEWEEMKEYFKGCVRCGSDESIVKDHIIPLYQGGSDGIENLQPLCKKCNSSKGAENVDFRIKNKTNACEMPAVWFKMPAIKEKKVNKSIDDKKESPASTFLSNLIGSVQPKELLKLDGQYGEHAQRQTSKNLNQLEKLKNEFLAENEALSSSWKDLKDLKQHFIFWVNKQPISKGLVYTGPKTNTIDHSKPLSHA